ncbi:SDR family NAD(P)-dependent oxidoreductase [Natronosalvus caseinilyticus]|uniref:SDR family NAD(P)-dependent oxidoreductase n=1 Tax=Natronosalvus caseinilyticus TaxID=2953747 RepID=UPI0028AAC361|nr:SDR family NAD(P)-dependent oxidoreductase [Natronosalvus caseinilyticus]
MSTTRGAIVVGASSGIGEALARELAAEGYELGLAARRTERLSSIGESLPTSAYVATMDVTDVEDARAGFDELIEAMPPVDLVVLSAGVGGPNRGLEWDHERETIDVNVRGFTALASAAMDHFENRQAFESERDGHLVGISSVASRFGNPSSPAYNASKAFVSTYLEGLRYRQSKRAADVTITTVEPGYVDTDLMLAEDPFWVSSPETAAAQIARAIRRERSHVYVTQRWRLVAWLFEALPEPVVRRIMT